jgi:hypothetical protein
VIPGGTRGLVFGNALFANLGGGRFQEVSDSSGVETYWPWGPSVDDLNADGWDDIFIAAGMSFPFRYSINSVLLNDAGRRFLPSEVVLGVEPRSSSDDGMQQLWFTLECEGADRGNPLCNACRHTPAMQIVCQPDGAGRVKVIAARSTRSAVILDLDSDGDLDLVTNEFNAGPQVLISDLAQRNGVQFLKVRLRGTHSNRQGVGAQVTVELQDRRILKVMDGKSGYLSQSDLPLYFGLGGTGKITAIEVVWPSGKVQKVDGPIEPGATLDIVEQER